MKSTSKKSRDHRKADKVATERDHLLLSSPPGYNSSNSSIRERRPATAPSTVDNASGNRNNNKKHHSSLAMRSGGTSLSAEGESASVPSRSYDHEQVVSGGTSSYEIYNENTDNIRSFRSARSIRSMRSQQMSRGSRTFSEKDRQYARADKLHDYYNERAKTIFSEQSHREEPLVEVSPEVLAVRKNALKVYEPLTYTWLIFTVGFSICAAMSMAKWSGLLPDATYWFLLLPCWLSHAGLFFCHIYSAKSLFSFIHDANSNRQRPDSTDHIDRTEYLPLLQRALKFGLKTGAISFSLFAFEILLYFRLAYGSPNLSIVFIPIWIIVGFGIIDGLICKTQHISRVLSWFLTLSFMVLLVLRVDCGHDEELTLQVLLSPLVALFVITMGSLMYVLYGNQIGYFRLTDSQKNAGVLYSLAASCVLLLSGIFYMVHMRRPNDFKIRVVMVAIAPLSVALMGLGAWAISRDEFERLLQYGGQSSVQPMKLRLEIRGWTTVESKGATVIPMFGEVRYEPLDPTTKAKIVELCRCCACYPYEDEEEGMMQSLDYPMFSDNVPTLRIPSSR